MSMQGYVIRTATTFDDSILRREINNEVEYDEEDQIISPRGAMDFPDEPAQAKMIDKKNTSIISKSSVSSSRSLKRNLSDSQLVAHMSKSMHSWKCNLCFHDNLNTIQTICSMCGTHMDASFMAALNALDNLKDPSIHNDEENVSEEDCVRSGDGDQDKLFPASLTDRDNSFQTAEEDATFVSFETARQSVNMRTDVSTIYAETVGTSIQGDGSMEDQNEDNSSVSNRKSVVSDKIGSVASNATRGSSGKQSQSLKNISVNSSITMENQNSFMQNASMLDGIEVQHGDATASKSPVENTDDSIHTLLNVTNAEADDEFDPMLFQNDDAMDADFLYDRQDDEGFQGVECSYNHEHIIETITGQPFGFEKEIQLDEYIKRSQEIERQVCAGSPDKFPYVPRREDESVEVGEGNFKSQVQIEVPTGDQEEMIQERESFVNQNIWRIRKTVAVLVITVALVSVFALS